MEKYKYCVIILLLTQLLFSQNNITIGNSSGNNNSEIEIPVLINNSQSFTGFQFDVTIPNNISYVVNSIIQSSRFVNHSISASVINSTTLRFICYSPNNTNFNGNSGEIFRFKLLPNTIPSTYPVSITNAILTNASAVNILNSTSNGTLQVLINNSINEIIIGNSSGNNFSEIEVLNSQSFLEKYFA
jgi:hypothetical protein